MSNLIRSAEVIAAEIRSIDVQTREIVLRSAIEIGKRLNEAKELVPHGEWGTWLEESVDYSQSTANNLMKIAVEYGSNSQAIGNLTYTKALALLGVPADEREQFAKEHDAENVSARELQQAVKEKKEAEKRAKAAEQAVEKERKEREALEKRVAELQDKLFDAEIEGDNDEAQKLQDELKEAQAKVKELEAELKAKPIDVPAVVEKVPSEIQAELDDLRQKITQNGNAPAIKFKLCFESLVSGFQNVLCALEEITDEPDRAKYKGAVSGLIGKMEKELH